MKRDIILSGVGGQGILSIATVIGRAALAEGLQLKQAEVHGMSQRGGSVSTQVRYGTKVYSPIIGRGQADILVAFETMEAIRYLPDLKPGGKVVVNDYQMPSLPILSGEREYPDSILEELRSKADTLVLDAAAIARDNGNPKGMNVVLLGALIRALGLQDIDWATALRANVKRQLADVNLRCLDAGMHASEAVAG